MVFSKKHVKWEHPRSLLSHTQMLFMRNMEIYFLASRDAKKVHIYPVDLLPTEECSWNRLLSDVFTTNQIFHLLVSSSAMLPPARVEGWRTAISQFLSC